MELKKRISSSKNPSESPQKIGYIEEKDGKFYEGILEMKTYDQTQPGQVFITYEGEVTLTNGKDIIPGVIWIETSIYQQVDDISDPALEKEVVVKFNDRLFKGNTEIEMEKGMDQSTLSFSYFGKLYYDDTLKEKDITE